MDCEIRALTGRRDCWRLPGFIWALRQVVDAYTGLEGSRKVQSSGVRAGGSGSGHKGNRGLEERVDQSMTYNVCLEVKSAAFCFSIVCLCVLSRGQDGWLDDITSEENSSHWTLTLLLCLVFKIRAGFYYEVVIYRDCVCVSVRERVCVWGESG